MTGLLNYGTWCSAIHIPRKLCRLARECASWEFRPPEDNRTRSGYERAWESCVLPLCEVCACEPYASPFLELGAKYPQLTFPPAGNSQPAASKRTFSYTLFLGEPRRKTLFYSVPLANKLPS